MTEEIERYEVPEGFDLAERELDVGLSLPYGGVLSRLGFHWRSRRIHRASQFVDAVARICDEPLDEFLDSINAGPDRAAELLESAIVDAASIGDEDHRLRLARVVARGVRGDDAALDTAEIVRQELRKLQPFHVRVMAFVAAVERDTYVHLDDFAATMGLNSTALQVVLNDLKDPKDLVDRTGHGGYEPTYKGDWLLKALSEASRHRLAQVMAKDAVARSAKRDRFCSSKVDRGARSGSASRGVTDPSYFGTYYVLSHCGRWTTSRETAKWTLRLS